MRTLLLAIAAVSLSACKIQISVPQGGSVQTDSGLYACAEFEHCVITVDHLFFTETFRAVAQQGYQFAGWERGQGYFCGGSTGPCATNTLEFGGNDGLLSVLYSDQDFYLVPVFTQTQTAPQRSADIPVSSAHLQTNYLVEGDTPQGIIDSMLGPANPIAGEEGDTIGLASFEIQVPFSYAFGPGTCYFVDFELWPSYATTLPQLTDADQKPAALLSEWQDFYGRVLDHEIGHQEVNRAHIHAFLDTLRDFDEWFYPASTQAECEERLLDSLQTAMVDQFSVLDGLQSDYHDRVGTTISWGKSTISGTKRALYHHAKLEPPRVTFTPQRVNPPQS